MDGQWSSSSFSRRSSGIHRSLKVGGGRVSLQNWDHDVKNTYCHCGPCIPTSVCVGQSKICTVQQQLKAEYSKKRESCLNLFFISSVGTRFLSLWAKRRHPKPINLDADIFRIVQAFVWRQDSIYLGTNSIRPLDSRHQRRNLGSEWYKKLDNNTVIYAYRVNLMH